MPDGPVRAEDHVSLARALTRRVFRRPTDDDFGTAIVALVEAAAQWNAGRRPCRWSTFAGNRIRWDLVARFQLASAAAIAAEVPLYLPGEDEGEEVERWAMAVEDPEFPAAEARMDVEALLATLPRKEALVLRRVYGVGVAKATLDEVGRDLGVGKERVRQIKAGALAKLRGRVGGGRYASS